MILIGSRSLRGGIPRGERDIVALRAPYREESGIG